MCTRRGTIVPVCSRGGDPHPRFSAWSKIASVSALVLSMFFAEGGGKGWKNLSYGRAMAPFLTGPSNFHKSTLVPCLPLPAPFFNTPFPILVVPAMEEARIDGERFKLIRGRGDAIHVRRGPPFSRGRHRSFLLSRRRWNIPLAVV